MPSPIDQFLTAIGYPERAPDGASSFSVLVDGGEVLVRAEGDRLFFSRALACEGEDLPRLAALAPGRMLREEAVLAAEPGPGGAAMQRAFESFCDSCDWWLERVGELSEPEPEIPPMMIRP